MATTLYTIGFTKSSAESFFERLRKAGVRRLIDIRLHNTNTLAGFTRRDDLAYFLGQILDCEYFHEPMLAPTAELLKAYQGKEIGWDEFARQFQALLDQDRAETVIDRDSLRVPTVLLCSEATADRCHRRLVAEHLARAWRDLEVVHL